MSEAERLKHRPGGPRLKQKLAAMESCAGKRETVNACRRHSTCFCVTFMLVSAAASLSKGEQKHVDALALARLHGRPELSTLISHRVKQAVHIQSWGLRSAIAWGIAFCLAGGGPLHLVDK